MLHCLSTAFRSSRGTDGLRHKRTKPACAYAMFSVYTKWSHTRNIYNKNCKSQTSGSFHVNSTNFWMFFHAPPRIVLKFGTVVEHGKKKTSLIFIFFISHVESEI